MNEQSKAARRRYFDGAFHSRYFSGDGVDIGGAPDPLSQYIGIFPKLRSVRIWDWEDGDAQFMAGVPDESFDFVHASHSLEHMKDVKEALTHWVRITKPGGFLIITIPDEDLYEHGQWPSRYNSDHKWSFAICKKSSPMPNSLNVVDLAIAFCDQLDLEKVQKISDFFRPELGNADQTHSPVTECAIEIIWRKRAANGSDAPSHPLAGSQKPGANPPSSSSPALTLEGLHVRMKKCRHGWMQYFIHDQFVGRSLDEYGEYSEAECTLFNEMLTPGNVVLEAGANIGAHTIFLSKKVRSSGKVLVFEPQPHVFKTLNGNVAINECWNVDSFQMGLGAEPRTMATPAYYLDREISMGSISLTTPNPEHLQYLVPVITIDSLNLPQLNLLKVDVEGMEHDVLFGAKDTISRCRPFLYIENDRQDKSPQLLELIFSLGYRIWWHLPKMFSGNNFFKNPKDVFPHNMVSINLFCIPQELEVEVQNFTPVLTADDWISNTTFVSRGEGNPTEEG